VLVERGDDLAALTALVDAASAGPGRLVFLGGEAGVGKTTLAAALAEVAAAHMTVRRGRCDKVTTAVPPGPVLEATDAGASRLRLFRRVDTVLSAVPTLLLIEDVHWADEATLDLLRSLGRRLAGRPVLVLATFRADARWTSPAARGQWRARCVRASSRRRSGAGQLR
jgi:predicted ATPase